MTGVIPRKGILVLSSAVQLTPAEDEPASASWQRGWQVLSVRAVLYLSSRFRVQFGPLRKEMMLNVLMNTHAVAGVKEGVKGTFSGY